MVCLVVCGTQQHQHCHMPCLGLAKVACKTDAFCDSFAYHALTLCMHNDKMLSALISGMLQEPVVASACMAGVQEVLASRKSSRARIPGRHYIDARL